LEQSQSIQYKTVIPINGDPYKTIVKDGIPIYLVSEYIKSIQRTSTKFSNTAYTYVTNLFPLFRWLESQNLAIEDITLHHIKNYIEFLRQQDLTQQTIRQYGGAILRFIRWCMEPDDAEKLLYRDKSRLITSKGFLAGISRREMTSFRESLPRVKKHLPEVMSIEEIHKIRTWITETYFDDFRLSTLYRCIIEVLFGGAVRRGELLALRIDSFDGSNLLVKNIPEKEFDVATIKKIGASLKTGERKLPLDSYTAYWIHRWKTECRPAKAHHLGHGFLFTSLHPDRYGQPLTGEAVRWLFNRINHPIYGAGLKRNIHPHLFRHTWATLAIEGGVSLTSIQWYLGHSNPNSTQIYTHISDPTITKELEKWRKEKTYKYFDLSGGDND
jgi:integrase/recombinase XerD